MKNEGVTIWSGKGSNDSVKTVINGDSVVINGQIRNVFDSSVEDKTGKELSAEIKAGTVNGDIVIETGANLTISGGKFTDKDNAEKYLEDGLKLNADGKVVPELITIIDPNNDNNTTTTTEKSANPATGANDFVGVAAALAVVSLLGMAVASRKKQIPFTAKNSPTGEFFYTIVYVKNILFSPAYSILCASLVNFLLKNV